MNPGIWIAAFIGYALLGEIFSRKVYPLMKRGLREDLQVPVKLTMIYLWPTCVAFIVAVLLVRWITLRIPKGIG